jgi:hypothetical protein
VRGRPFRQPLAEHAVVALGGFFESIATRRKRTLACTLRSNAERWKDAFDAYGRFIGQVSIWTRHGYRSVNEWLVETGWALPTFYESIGAYDLEALTDRAVMHANAHVESGGTIEVG